MGVIYQLMSQMVADGMPMMAILAAVKEAEDGAANGVLQDFAIWWQEYPNKVDKLDAQRKYAIARRKITAEVLLDGVRRYAAKRDDRPWKSPGTWLHKGCWEDAAVLPNRGLAGVRARLGMEIENEQSRAQELGGYADGRVPRLSLFDH